MANRWRNKGNSARLYFLGLQNHCRWQLQPWNKKTHAPWKKSYDQPRQHIKKQRYYFADKGPSSQIYGFSSSHVFGCESWTIKKAECWKIDAFELWCWRKLLRVPWTARRSNQSILKEINPEYSLERLMWKLKLQYLATWWEEPSHWKRPWCWERLKAGGEAGGQRMRWLDGITDSMDMNLSKLRQIVEDRGAWHAAAHKAAKSWTWLSNWATIY